MAVRLAWKQQSVGGGDASGLYVFADELDNIVHGGAGIEDSRDSSFLEKLKVLFGDNAAYQEQNIFHLVLTQQISHSRNDGVVCSGKDGEPDDVHVLLQG